MFRLPSPLERLDDERLAGLRVFVKRDDLIHPDFPGNKWRKLKYNLPPARSTVLTFGGAYSSHLRATAAAGRHFGFKTVGVVRGEERLPLNPVLSAAVADGMALTYVSRSTYRLGASPGLLSDLTARYGDFHLIPEGGANDAGRRGCAELVDEIDEPFDVICCSVGTGTTLAGIAGRLKPSQRAIGYAAIKGHRPHPDVEPGFHFGGYAKRTAELDAFIADFRERHGITLDWVYEAKMMYGIVAQAGRFPPGATLIAVIA
ncbi:pyridoxal-phosphate dependent enzyme [Actinoplanes sp. KI2]|uniref:1-aminocyclopropane-1-carboxylate deaminase/D-cysteine desulfhydrase n=1 Tax=Actinoplanes sp. KI2 TaxID=2983315 RepID=UPI0021D5E022|nr:pyridoxal-phosphate dependent enzyme [Actinoplanes sp. KI2]MCU7725802.1 pyridoxal-phosphate dependent enzyme [Actinoplanes sp. KI2]